MNRKNELLKNSIIIGIGNIFTKAISFLLVPLFTLWLTTKQYGDYDLLYSYVSLIVPAITLQLEQANLRYTLEKKADGPRYFHVSAIVVIINSIIIGVIFGLICHFEYHSAFAFCSIAYALQIYMTEYLRGCNELKQYSIANIFCGICTIVFSFVLVKICNFGVSGLLTAFGLSYLLTAAVIYIQKRLYQGIRKDLSNDNMTTLKLLLAYSLPLLPNAISWWITNVSDRTIIRVFIGSHYNGLYAVSCKIPSLITVFYGIFNLAWQQSAILSAKDDLEERKKFYGSIFRQLSVFLFSGAFVVISATPILYKLFLKPEYMDGINVVPILIWATVMLNLAQFLGGILLGFKDTKTNGSTTVLAAIVNLAIDLLLIQKIGLYAAAGSTLVSYFLMMILRMKKLKSLFDMKKVISTVTIGSLAVIGVSALMITIQNFLFQWAILLLMIVLFFFMNRKTIRSILNRAKRRSVSCG